MKPVRTRTIPARSKSILGVALGALLLGTPLFAGCEASMNARELGSETHFLGSCVTTCEGGLSCLCGVCTRVCDDAASCSDLSAAAECVPLAPRVAEGSCASSSATAFCDVDCEVDADCAALGSAPVCDAGYCREQATPAESCERAEENAGSVVVMGDAIIELSPFTSRIEELARASGALAPSAGFRSYASSLNSFLAGDTLSLAVQYDAARTEAPVRVVIMNGGETDTMQGTCGDMPTSDCAALRAAADGAATLFARMAADGVEEVVYFFYADPVDRPMIKAGLDALRPLAEQACEGAPVTCHFIDLRPTFANHYDEYVASDGLVFSEAGAEASAGVVWSLMQAECVDW